MATLSIAPLREDELMLTPEPPEFETLAANELGNAGDDTDGFPSLLDEATQLVGDEPGVMTGLDSEETEASNTMPGIEADEESPLIAQMAAANEAGDVIIGEFETDVVDPTTPPPPTDGGGGDGGGGGGGGGGTGGQGGIDTGTRGDVSPFDNAPTGGGGIPIQRE